MAEEQLREALVLLKKAQEAVEECLEEYGGESYDKPAESGEAPLAPEGDRMSKMMSIMGKRR